MTKIGTITGVLPNSSAKIGGIKINSAVRKLSPNEAINDKITKLKKVLSKITDKNSISHDLTYFDSKTGLTYYNGKPYTGFCYFDKNNESIIPLGTYYKGGKPALTIEKYSEPGLGGLNQLIVSNKSTGNFVIFEEKLKPSKFEDYYRSYTNGIKKEITGNADGMHKLFELA